MGLEEKVDALSDKIYALTGAVAGLDARMSSIENFMVEERERCRTVEASINQVQQQVAVINGVADSKNKSWQKFAPFLTIMFGGALGLGSSIVLHIFR